jgi:hypothetical protein
MPISVSCRSCGKKMKAPDSFAGKRVKCPGCGKPLAVPASAAEPPPPPPEDDNPFGSMYAPGTAAAAAHTEEQTGEPQFPGTRPGWTRVRTGLNLLRIAVVFRSFVTMAMILWLVIAFVADKPFFKEADKEGKIERYSKLSADIARPAMNLLAMPLTVLGLMLCVGAPMAKGAKLLALLALFLSMLMFVSFCPGNLGVFVFDVAHLDSSRFENVIPMVNYAGMAGAVAEFAMFFICIFFLRACAVTFNQRVGVMSLLIMGFIWIALACGVGAYVIAASGNLSNLKETDQVLGEFKQPGQIALIAAIALNVLGLFWFLHYIISISTVRGIILRNLFRLAPE